MYVYYSSMYSKLDCFIFCLLPCQCLKLIFQFTIEIYNFNLIENSTSHLQNFNLFLVNFNAKHE